MTPRTAIATLIAAGSILTGPAALGAGQETVSLVPSRFRGTADANRLYGPLTVGNTTNTDYEALAVPVLLGQLPDSGAFVVRDDKAAKAEAARLLSPSHERFALPSGGKGSVLARTSGIGPEQGVYVGLLFVATPQNAGQIQEILRLNALFLLDPRRPQIDMDPSPIDATQIGPGKLGLQVPVRNTGNVYTPLGGRVTIAQRGKPVTTVDLTHRNILPGVLLDLPGAIDARLPAGDYEMTGTLRSRNKRFPIKGSMRLFGPNQIATPGAKIVKFDSPTAYRDEPVDIHATFKNTGNVKFSPSAEIRVGVLGADAKAKSLGTAKLSVESTEPGAIGDVTGSVRLPSHGRQFQLTLVLSDHGKVLDTASLGVGVRPKPSSSFPWWIVLAAIALVVVAGLALRHRRRSDQAGSTPPRPAERATAVAAPAMPTADQSAAGVDLNAATTEQLTTVPGIGPKAAERIVEHRDEYGSFASVEALADVEGFGEKRVRAVVPHLRV